MAVAHLNLSPAYMLHRTRGAAAVRAASSLARRAKRNLKPISSYIPQFMKAMERPWSDSDPDGCIVMVVAENRLLSERMLQRLNQCSPASLPDLFYADFRGTTRLRESLAHFMSQHIVDAQNPVMSNNLALSNGCGAVLDNLFHSICDIGDSVLLPAPLYPTFINDLEAKSGLKPVVVSTEASRGFFPTAAELDHAADSAHSPARALLLTNPTNPLGTVIPSHVYAEAIHWAVTRGIHVVSDEIYACSVFGDSIARFVSAWDLATELSSEHQSLVHIVYGLAKDFGMSGLRIGALASRNQELLDVHSNIGYFQTIPGPTQSVCAEILSDDAWVRDFLQDNRIALAQSYDQLTAALDSVGVKYLPGGAAMFLWLDLRDALPPSATWSDERKLFHDMHDRGILLTPGQDCYASEPGFFRACWAASPPQAHSTAAARIASVRNSIRQ